MPRKSNPIFIIFLFLLILSVVNLICWLPYKTVNTFGPDVKRVFLTILTMSLLFVIIAFFGTLRSLITYENILNNYNRANIYVMIKNNPGIHFSELVKKLQLSNAQAFWHLLWLERFDLIKRVKSSKYHLFYLNDGTNLNLEEFIVHSIIFKSESRKKIYQLICEKPGISQDTIKKESNLSQSTIAYHLIILEQDDLIYHQKINFKQMYFPKKVIDIS